MKCSLCDFDNRAGARFCTQCGSRLEEPIVLPLAVPTMLLLPPPETETPEPAPLTTRLSSEPETPPSPPLAVGTLLKERYQILALEQEGPPRVYEALDLLACGVCGQRDNPPGSTFCQECGAELGQVRVRLLEGESPDSPAADNPTAGNPAPDSTNGEIQLDQIDSDGLPLAVESLSMPAAPIQAPVFSRGVRLDCGQESHIGPRSVNQDSTLALLLSALVESTAQPSVALGIVADGMGGHQGGEIASRLAVQLISIAVVQNLISPLQAGRWRREIVEGQSWAQVDDNWVQRWLEAAIQDANLEIWHTGQDTGKDMGTTLALAFAVGSRVYVANVGDSRTYMWGHDGLRQVSRDHSFVAELVAGGHLAEEDSYTHPQRNLITRSLGSEPEVKVDFFQVDLRPGESVLLCSDGLWEPLRSAGIRDGFLAQQVPQETAKFLVDNALALGASDNISAVVLTAHEW